MKQWSKLALLGAMLTAAAFAQPSIKSGGVVNAASNIGPGLPNSGVAQGAMFIIYGTNLGPSGIVQANSYPLPKTLGGTSVKVTVNGTSVDAIMIYSLATQVAAILPSATPTGTGTVTVTYNGQTSSTSSITVVPNAFGIFTLNQGGSGPAVIQNANSSTDLQVNTVTNSAKPGQVVILWGTGLGAVSGDEAAGALPGNITSAATKVYVGGQLASVTYAGRSGCCAGIDQVDFVVPSGVTGCYVPVVVQTSNTVSNSTSMSIAGNGGACSDPNGFTGTDLTQATTSGTLRSGAITLSRIATSITVPVLGTITTASETASADFAQYTAQNLIASSGQLGFQTIGACTVFNIAGNTPSLPTDPVLPTYLDAGTLKLTSSNGLNQTFTKDSTGTYSLTLSSSGTGIPTTGPSTAVLSPGTYTVQATGGSGANAVGPFTTQLTIPANVTWTNQDSINTIPRTSGLSITWTGGDPKGYVLIYGASITAAGGGAAFYCSSPTTAGQFTVPSYVLAALPASSSQSSGGISVPSGFLGVGSAGNPSRFTATGLDTGLFDYINESLKTVTFQ